MSEGKVLIIGGAGMVGRKLAERLAADGELGGRALASLHLADVVEPTLPAGLSDGVDRASVADLSEPGTAARLIADRPDTVFHLAAIVSGEAERDFDKGYRINLDGTRMLLDAIHAAHREDGYTPRVVFTSSIATFGVPFPDTIPDDYHLTPLTSYGAQKAIGELLVADHSRKGHLDGISIRLPTICIRPGKPNAAASSFFSGILREPINGQEAILPVGDDVRHWFASPRSAVGFLVHAATVPMERFREVCGAHASLDMPGLSATVAEQIDALERVVGSEAAARIRRERDPEIEAIVSTWPKGFEAHRARQLGFTAETSFDEIIRIYLEDEMDGATAN